MGGGYIAGDKALIEGLRKNSAGSVYHNSLSTVVCKQCIVSLKIMMGLDGSGMGQQKIKKLKENCNYFKKKLTEMGLHVYGHYDSPVIPVMIYNPAKIAAYTKEQLDYALNKIKEVTDLLQMNYKKHLV